MINKAMSSPFLVIFLLISAATLIYVIADRTGGDSLPIVILEDEFIDVDGDGDSDLVIYAEVVLNGSTTFLLSEPEQSDTIEDNDEQVVDNSIQDGSKVAAVFTLFREVDEPLMSSGESYAEWKDRAARCPDNIPYWSTITLPGGEEFVCLHRNAVLYHKTLSEGEIHIGLLIDSLPVPLDTRVNVKVTYP